MEMYIIAAILSLTIVYASRGQTTGGNSGGAPCAFPFVYDGYLYTSCITMNHTGLWCSTTHSYDIDKRWGECTEEDLNNLPTFDLTTKTNVTVPEGESARLPCIIANLNDKHVTWQMRGSAFPLTVSSESFYSRRFLVETIGNFQWNLIIKETTQRDAGVYQCRVTTRTMLLVREVRLNIIEDGYNTGNGASQEIDEGKTHQLYLDEGKPLVLKCNSSDVTVTRDTAVIQNNFIEWFKDGAKINSNARNGMMITTFIQNRVAESTLTIDNINIKDTGIYVCTSTDKTNAKFRVELTNYNTRMSQDQPIENQNGYRTTGSSLNSPPLEQNRGGGNSAVTVSSEVRLVLVTIFSYCFMEGY